MSRTLHRISLGLGANAFGQIVTVAIQLISLPAFLHFWPLSRYGEWLLLAAIPAYLSAVDIGILSVGMNRMAILAAMGDIKAAERIFQSLLCFATAVILVVACVVLPAIWLIHAGDWGTNFEHRLTLSLLVIADLACIYTGLFEAVFRVCDRYALGVLALNFARLAEWLGSLVGLVMGGTLVDVGLGLLAGRLIATASTCIYQIYRYPNYRWSFRGASKAELVSMVAPGLSFLALPAANALSIQGMVILIGTMFGTPALAVFSAYRTLSRIAFQLINMLSRVLWPEFSRRFGEKDYGTMHELCRYGTLATVVASLGGAAVLYFIGPFLLHWWTHGKIVYIPGLFNILLIVTAFSGSYQVGLILLAAVNKLAGLSIVYISASLLSVGASYLAGKRFGIDGATAAMILTEVVMICTCYFYVRGFFDEHTPRRTPSLAPQ
jgi:O-antigen/teichoic acid export membrane protein